MAKPLALRPIADLIVVLYAKKMALEGNARRRCATRPSPKFKMLALKGKPFVQRARNLLQAAKILVVSAALARQRGMHRVMEIIAPHRIQGVATLRERSHERRIIRIAL